MNGSQKLGLLYHALCVRRESAMALPAASQRRSRQDLADVPVLEDAGSRADAQAQLLLVLPDPEEDPGGQARRAWSAVPRDKADVMRVAAACARHRVPLTVRGGGTGDPGQDGPTRGGVVLDMGRLDQVIWHSGRRTICRGRAHARHRPRAGAGGMGSVSILRPTSTTMGGFVAGGAAAPAPAPGHPILGACAFIRSRS